VKWIALLAIAGACVVPDVDLEGRPCPCATGYECDRARNVCARPSLVDGGRDAASPTDAGAPLDVGPFDGGTDAALECVLYDDFDDGALDEWRVLGGTWDVVDGHATQHDAMSGAAFMVAPGTVELDFVRVRARMRQISSGRTDGALEIDWRVDPGNPTEQYHCNYEPNVPAMRLQRESVDIQKFLDERVIGGVPGPLEPVTMVVEIRGDSFRCRLEEVVNSEVEGVDTVFTTGGIGLKTWMMSGAFDWFEICRLPPD
jgi:hypothetical protein